LRYPKLQYFEEGRDRIKLMNIGDSFFWNIFGKEVCKRIFDTTTFGFYFHEIHSPYVNGIMDRDQVDVKSLIAKHDVVMLLNTEGTMLNFPFDFDRIAYNLYCTELSDTAFYNRKLEEIKQQIRTIPEWFKSVKEKSEQSGKPLEETIQTEALFILHKQGR
jgi:hypothetical protein